MCPLINISSIVSIPGLESSRRKHVDRTFKNLTEFIKHMKNQNYPKVTTNPNGDAELDCLANSHCPTPIMEAGRTLDTTGGNLDEDELDAVIEENQKLWSYTPDGNLFWATTNIAQSVPPGLYKCIYTDNVGHALQKLLVATDDLIPLPDTATSIVVKEINEFWNMETTFTSRGFLHKRGILMYGEPGSGKTAAIQQLVAKIIERNGIAVYAEDPHILTACLQMFRRVESTRPVIVILEDFETLTDRNQHENQWLSVLDGEAQINNVVFLATTNYIELLDKRFTDRPSRFDVVMAVPMPSAKARAIYLKVKEPSLDKPALREWVEKSKGFSIAHLKEMIISCKCYGRPLDEVVERLHEMQRRKFKNDELAYDPDTDGGQKVTMGFTGGEQDPVTDEDLDWDSWNPDEEDIRHAGTYQPEVQSGTSED